MPPFFYISTWLIRLVLPLLTRWRVIGRENVPRHGPLILVSNHLSTTDPALISAALLPRRSVFMAKEELFHYWGTPIIRAYGAIPVRRNQFDRRAIRRASRVLDRGLLLGIFPEGHRSVACQLQSAYLGAAFMALRHGVPVLPVAITGSQHLMTSKLLRRPELTIRIGQPIPPAGPDGKLTKDNLESFTHLFMGRIAALLPSAYQGVYGASENED